MARTVLPKRVAIANANTQTVVIVSIATFLSIFCLFAAKTAWSQNRYQARVTVAKEAAHRQLLSNARAYDSLLASYQDFEGNNVNVIDGSSDGTGDRDGKNSRIVLDALPSSYDFPA